jgi:hypothetical protein
MAIVTITCTKCNTFSIRSNDVEGAMRLADQHSAGCTPLTNHDALCLTAAGDTLCNCDAIAACKAATHDPRCPMRDHETHAHDGYVDNCQCPYLPEGDL